MLIKGLYRDLRPHLPFFSFVYQQKCSKIKYFCRKYSLQIDLFGNLFELDADIQKFQFISHAIVYHKSCITHKRYIRIDCKIQT